MIIKDSEEEGVFVKEVIEVFKEINMSNLSDIEWLEDVVCSLASSIKKNIGQKLKNCQHHKALQELVEYTLQQGPGKV